MDVLRSIDFTDALVFLQGLIGSPVKVNVNFYGRFFGCGFEGELGCVETLPPDHSAISLVLDDRQGFFLDPAEAEAFLGRGAAGQSADWLEFRIASGLSMTVERAAAPDG